MRPTPIELDIIRSKPIIQLTDAELDALDPQERGWVVAQLARWDEQDKATQE